MKNLADMTPDKARQLLAQANCNGATDPDYLDALRTLAGMQYEYAVKDRWSLEDPTTAPWFESEETLRWQAQNSAMPRKWSIVRRLVGKVEET